jgi:hypothetical protein
VRGTAQQKLSVKLAASPRLPREMKKYEDHDFEFRVRDLAAADRMTPDLSDVQQGVLVETVREGGWAALSHLADGDVARDRLPFRWPGQRKWIAWRATSRRQWC